MMQGEQHILVTLFLKYSQVAELHMYVVKRAARLIET